MIGGHLPASDAWTLSLITNAEVLAVNQRSRNNRQLFHANGLGGLDRRRPGRAGTSTWPCSTRATRTGRGSIPGSPFRSGWPISGSTGSVAVTDVWTGKPVGVVGGEFAPVVPYHGAGLYRLRVQ